MATLQMRDYGGIGAASISEALGKLADGTTRLARDKKTWLAAVNDTSATNDTVELNFDTAANSFVAIDYSMPCWNNGTLAIGTGVTLVVAGTSSSGGPLFNGGAGKTNFLLTGTGDANPSGWGGEKSGKFAIIIDPAQTPANVHTQVMAFTTSNGIEVAYLYILGNWDLSGGCPKAGTSMTTAGFTYPGTGGCNSSDPGANDITLRCVTYDHGPAGYGPTQVQSGTNLRFFSLKAIGGKALRVEQDAGNMNYIKNLTADGIWGKSNSRGVVALETHDDNSCSGTGGKAPGTLDGTVSITNVTSEESGSAIHIGGRCKPSNGAGFQGTITIDGVAAKGSSGSGTASDPYSKNAQVITGGGGGTSACWVFGTSVNVLDGTKPSCVTLDNVVTSGHFSGGTQGYNSAVGFASRFGQKFPCQAGPHVASAGHGSTHISAAVGGGGSTQQTTAPSHGHGATSVTGIVGSPPHDAVASPGHGHTSVTGVVSDAPPGLPSPTFLITPPDPDTNPAPYFVARSPVPASWQWRVDGGIIMQGGHRVTIDHLTIPGMKVGVHDVEARLITDAGIGEWARFTWNISQIILGDVPGPAILGSDPYTIWLMDRKGLSRITPLADVAVSWERLEDGSSTAKVTIPAEILPECATLLASLKSWAFSIGLWRGDLNVWEGPITDGNYSTGELNASDVSVYLARRALHQKHADVAVDGCDVVQSYIRDAMGIDPPGYSTLIVAESGKPVTRSVPAGTRQALAEVQEVMKIGVHYTVLRRQFRIGRPSSEPVALLTDSAFSVPPQVPFDGNQLATKAIVVNQSGADGTESVLASATLPGADASQGVHEVILTDSASDGSTPLLEARAAVQPEMVGLSEGVLAPGAPVTVNQLLPGSVFQLNLTQGARPVSGLYRLETVGGGAAPGQPEQIKVTFVPA